MDTEPLTIETARKAILNTMVWIFLKTTMPQPNKAFEFISFKNGNPTERRKQTNAMISASYEKPSYFWNKTIYVPNYNYIFPHPTIHEVVDIKGLPDIFEKTMM